MIIVITGPTAVGKTKLSLEIAKKYKAEIINCDSVQIYKELNIGSAKITKEEMGGITHHLIDYKSVYDNYTVYDYQKDARNIIDNLCKQNKNIVLVGGTGLYIKASLYDYRFSKEEEVNNFEDMSTSSLYEYLLSLNKDISIDKNNRRRLIRAINYYNNTNSSINDNNMGDNLLYDAIFIGLTTDRDVLYNKINDRVDKMMEEGLLEEARGLYDSNVNTKAVNSIGYKELYEYFKGLTTLDCAVDKIKRNSRRYAKRQYTFFNNKMDIKWFRTNFDDFGKTVGEVCDYIDMVRSKI